MTLKIKFTILSLSLLSSAAWAAPVADVFSCDARHFFSRLRLEIKLEKTTLLTLKGIDAFRVAEGLNLKLSSSEPIDKVVLEFANDWCALSSSRLAVVKCILPQTWPPPVVTIKALNKAGSVLGTDTLSYVSARIDHVNRTIADTVTDITFEELAFQFSAISQTDNSKRAGLNLAFNPSECEKGPLRW